MHLNSSIFQVKFPKCGHCIRDDMMSATNCQIPQREREREREREKGTERERNVNLDENIWVLILFSLKFF